MKGLVLAFGLGLVVGEIDPVGWAAWQWIERQMPAFKEESLASDSPFLRMPRSRWIAESPRAFAIENRYAPMAPVHLLVVPKERYPSLLETPDEVLGELLGLARRVARERGIDEAGFRIVINTNPLGGQTVYHTHVHVKGGEQVREPLLRMAWSRLRHLGGDSATPPDPPAADPASR